MFNQEHKHLIFKIYIFLNLAGYPRLVLLLPKIIDTILTTYLPIMVLVDAVSLLILKLTTREMQRIFKKNQTTSIIFSQYVVA